MKKSYKTVLKITGVVLLLALVVLFIVRYSTKAHSPEDISHYEEASLKLEVFYNRPSKKDRIIFGDLVPYGEVWRTGANEATTFYSNEDLLVDGSLLKAGKYTLWTIPMKDSWKVIFNSKMYPWGIDLDKKAYRDPDFDVLTLEIPVTQPDIILEQFSIYFEKANDLVFLKLAWDQTLVAIPLKMAKEAQIAPLSSN
ncbi:MAG TPA: DUF2911 domain-containing protein [Gillisia sp.]|nr:DUF2911 domain-containing protein [Gillisia sp.]